MNERKSIHYSELAPLPPGELLHEEFNHYLAVVGDLLAAGHSGRVVLIKGKEVVGIFDDWKCARETGLWRFYPEPFFLHVIRSEEPVLRTRQFFGCLR